MAVAELDGLEIAHDVVGEGQPWILAPGGRSESEVQAEALGAPDVILDDLAYGRPPTRKEVSASEGTAAVMTEHAGRPRAVHPAARTRAGGEKVLHAVAEAIDDEARGLHRTTIEGDDGLGRFEAAPA